MSALAEEQDLCERARAAVTAAMAAYEHVVALVVERDAIEEAVYGRVGSGDSWDPAWAAMRARTGVDDLASILRAIGETIEEGPASGGRSCVDALRVIPAWHMAAG